MDGRTGRSCRVRRGATRYRAWGDTCRAAVEQPVLPQAGIPVAAFRIQDPQLGMPPRRAVSTPGHRHQAVLPDHVSAEPDPAGLCQLEPEPTRLVQRTTQSCTDRDRLYHQEQRTGPSGQRRQPSRTITNARSDERRFPAIRKVQHQHIDGPGGEERRRQGQRLPEIDRREHDEPLETYATRHRLDRVDGAGQVQPDEASPRSATVPTRGIPPVPSRASRAANPVDTTRSSPSVTRSRGRGALDGMRSVVAGSNASSESSGSPGTGTRASEPSTGRSTPRRGAAAPQRDWSRNRVSETSDERVIGHPMIEHSF
jgi:hypothetical protein